MNARMAMLVRTLLFLSFGLVGAFVGVALGTIVWGLVLPSCPPPPRREVCDAPAMVGTIANLFTSLPLGAIAGAVLGDRLGSRLTLR